MSSASSERANPPAGHRLGSQVPRLPAWLLPIGIVVAAAVIWRYLGEIDDRTQWFMVDLDVYRWGGETAASSEPLYTARYGGFLLFTYTPFAAATFIPVSALDLANLRPIMSGLNVTALVVIVGACFHSLGYRLTRGTIGAGLLVASIAALLEPVYETMRLGQVNLILAAIILVDLLLPDSSRWKGCGVGLATGLKLTPAIFIPYLLLTRRIPAAVRAICTAAATVLVGFIVLPHESSDYWFGRLFMDSDRVGGVDYLGNQSVNGSLVRVFGAGGTATLVWLMVVALVLFVGFWFARSLHEGVRTRRVPELAPLVVVALTGLLVSPVSWSHHWVWIVPTLVLFADLALRRDPRWWGAALGTVAVTIPLPSSPGIIWLAPAAGFAERDWTFPESMAGNLYVLVGMAALVAAALRWRSWTTRTPMIPADPSGNQVSDLSARR